MLSSTSLSYAATISVESDCKGQTIKCFDTSDEIAEYIEDFVGKEDLNKTIIEKESGYYAEGTDCDIIMPKDGNDYVSIQSEACDINMELPNEVRRTTEYLSENGTVIYGSKDKNVSIAVQALYDEQDGIIFDAVRTMITIDYSNASKEYSFKYDLPKGCELITSEEYYGVENAEPGWIYIVDNNNSYIDLETGKEVADIIAVIEPAWAKDANGNNINTSYRVKGNTLIQIVQFNERSAFPIVADPTTYAKPRNYKIETVFSESFKFNNATLGLPGLGASTVSNVLSKKAKEKATSLIVAKLGSKVIPVVSWIMWGLSAYCTYQSYKEYTYTKVTLVCDKWAIYKHQGGKRVQGIGYKSNLSFAGSN